MSMITKTIAVQGAAYTLTYPKNWRDGAGEYAASFSLEQAGSDERFSALGGIGQLLLNLASHGVDVESQAFLDALQTTVNDIAEGEY